LIGCSVCPGFEMQDFSWGHSDKLLERFPDKFEIIDRLKPRPLP